MKYMWPLILEGAKKQGISYQSMVSNFNISGTGLGVTLVETQVQRIGSS